MDKNRRAFFKKSILGIGVGIGLGLLSYLKPVNALQNINFSDGSTQAVAYHGNKNLIINGNFDIWQRGTASTPLSNNLFLADRFHVGFAMSSATGTIEQSSDAPDDYSQYSSLLTVTGTETPTGTNNVTFNQKIEGYNIRRLGFGTSSARSITISFWVKSLLTGTFCGSIANSTFDRVYIYEYTINSANTWEKKTITIHGDTTGNWNVSISTGIWVRWALSVGSDFISTANSWIGTTDFATASYTNLFGTNSATWQIAKVQLEEGDKATDFEFEDYIFQLAKCQRYLLSHTFGIGAVGLYSCPGSMTTTTIADFCIPTPVSMRTTPSVSLVPVYNTGSGWQINTSSTNAVLSTSPQVVERSDFAVNLRLTIGSGITEHDTCYLYNNTGQTGYLIFNAEL